MIYDQVYKIITIADIHFGCSENPEYMYTQLMTQFINKISNLDFQIVAICGDLFHSKLMSNNPAITYAIQFIDDLVQLCAFKGATLMILAGTQSHDAGQLSLFYHYNKQPQIDVRIIEKIQFENIKGLRVLCIPEVYGYPESEYNNVLYNSGRYDLCILHGTFKGSFKGSEIATLNTNHAPVFGINHFCNCAGPILMGHYHIPSVYESYAYYNGSAFRFRFGEEEDKGFLLTLFNPFTRMHYTELIPIISHTYSTINIDHLINDDPKRIIDWIKSEKANRGIDFIRVQFNNANENMNIVRNYFRNVGNVKLQELGKKEKQIQQIDQEVLQQNQEYSYIIDSSIGDYDKFVMYINQQEGYDFITSDELIKLLEGDI